MQQPWWEIAPLGPTGCRALSQLPAAALQRLIDDSQALARHAIRKQLRALQGLLGDAEDLDQQITIWILEAATNYDPALGRWEVHLVHRVRQLAVNQWRTSVGRTAIQTLKRLRENGFTALAPTEQLHANRIRSLLPGGQQCLDPHADLPHDPDEDLVGIEERSVHTQVTAALVNAGSADDAGHPRRRRALAAYLLCHLHGHPRRRVAACGIHHRTITALENELLGHVRQLLQPAP